MKRHFPNFLALLACVAAGLLLATGCASATGPRINRTKPQTSLAEATTRAQLIGTWYGRQPTKENDIREWITQRAEDGTFQVHFRTTRGDVVKDDSIEVGEWGFSAGHEVTITRGWLVAGRFKPAAPDSYFWDIYRITYLDDTTMRYHELDTEDHFEVRRVPDDFEFPPPGQPPSLPAGRKAEPHF